MGSFFFSLGRVWLGRIDEGLGLSLGTKRFLKLTGGLICSNGIISHSKYHNWLCRDVMDIVLWRILLSFDSQ